MKVILGKQHMDLVPENEAERDQLFYFINKQPSHYIHFHLHGRPEQVRELQHTPREGFIRVALGDPIPLPARKDSL